ncbi:hypothetical protein AB0W38_00415 [Aliarcobacter butzleri]|uniref:hypothetical protein n=1 Tax=Aliarcobacter butzleri TaxID=28197 RepID=UPI00344CBA2B
MSKLNLKSFIEEQTDNVKKEKIDAEIEREAILRANQKIKERNEREAGKKTYQPAPKIDPVVAWLAAQNDVQEFHLDNSGFVCVDKNCNCINKNNPVKGGEIIDAEIEEHEDNLQEWINN